MNARKLLLLVLSFIFTSPLVVNLVSCKVEKGKVIGMYYYNEGTFNSFAKGGKSFYENEIDGNKIYQNSLGKNNVSIQNNVIMPLMYGFNLTKDNNSGIKGAKWTSKQIKNSLQARKNEIINNKVLDVSKKKLWINFYNNYSTTDDSFYTQVGLTKEYNYEIYDPFSERILLQTSNYYEADKKENVDQLSINNSNYYLMVKNTLNVFAPIKQAIDWLNDPDNNFNKQYNDINQELILQSTRYALLELPDIVFIFEFTNKNNIFVFNVTVKHVAAKMTYLGYKNPHDVHNHKKTFGHQWFFTGYDFFDISKYNDDNLHMYNMKINPGIKNTKFAIGFIDYNNPFVLLGIDRARRIDKDVGIFKHKETEFTVPELDWNIEIDSITKGIK